MREIGYIHTSLHLLARHHSGAASDMTVVARSGEDVPGIIAMVVSIVFVGIFTLALSSLRRRLQSRCSKNETSSDDLS